MKRLRRINAVFCALSFALVAILNSAVAGQGTQALGINTEGDIVGNYRDSSFLTHGFLLSHGTFTILDKRVFSPFGINPQGEMKSWGSPYSASVYMVLRVLSALGRAVPREGELWRVSRSEYNRLCTL